MKVKVTITPDQFEAIGRVVTGKAVRPIAESGMLLTGFLRNVYLKAGEKSSILLEDGQAFSEIREMLDEEMQISEEEKDNGTE